MARNNNLDNSKAVCGIVVRPTTKRRKIHESIENTIIPDNVLHNILSQLSAKPLMRFRCASKHWNSLITDPYFMNSRSHRMILIPSDRTRLYAFDPKHQNIVKLTYPFKHQIYKCSIIGTLNGIVVLVLKKTMINKVIFILYNPLTRATKELPGQPSPCCPKAVSGYLYGFAHGNIISAQPRCTSPTNEYNNCNVFSLKNGSWTTPKTTFAGDHQMFEEKVGMFLNGFLHWVMVRAYNRLEIVALDVTEMVVTQMDTPRLSIDCYRHRLYVLGVLNGCLCMSTTWSHGFDVWVKEQSEWSKQYSFKLPFYRHGCRNGLDVFILEDGILLVKDQVSNQIIMCHLFERYYEIFKCASGIQVTSKVVLDRIGARCKVGKPFEYVESLVSPSDMCHV